jgi:hypothetical protein
MSKLRTSLGTIYSTRKSELQVLVDIDMNDIYDYWDNLATLDIEIKQLENRRDALIDAQCDNCPHPHQFLVEVAYRESTFFDFLPWRLCKLCGAAEEGWSYNFVKPKVVIKYVTSGELPQITSDDLIKLRTKIYSKED